jgi:hypothetical protein
LHSSHRSRLMKFLCLAFGSETDWNALSKPQQDALLAQDEVLRQRGDVVAALSQETTTVRAWDGSPSVTDGPFVTGALPLAGFSIIDAVDIDEAIRLVADTPCARAGGAVELRPIAASNLTAGGVTQGDGAAP